MSFILNTYQDPFVINGLVEGSAGVFTLLMPQIFFWGVKNNPHASLIARWWASAVTAIGVMSLLVSTLPESNIGRQYAGVGFLVYHILLTLLHNRVIDSYGARPTLLMYIGFFAHLAMSVVLLLHLHALGTLVSAAAVFMS